MLHGSFRLGLCLGVFAPISSIHAFVGEFRDHLRTLCTTIVVQNKTGDHLITPVNPCVPALELQN